MVLDILDCVEVWYRSLKAVFDSAGIEAQFRRSPTDRPKLACDLNLRHGDVEVDLVIWDSGEADLMVPVAYSTGIEPTSQTTQFLQGTWFNLQHYENLTNPRDLASVLSKLAQVLVRPAHE